MFPRFLSLSPFLSLFLVFSSSLMEHGPETIQDDIWPGGRCSSKNWEWYSCRYTVMQTGKIEFLWSYVMSWPTIFCAYLGNNVVTLCQLPSSFNSFWQSMSLIANRVDFETCKLVHQWHFIRLPLGFFQNMYASQWPTKTRPEKCDCRVTISAMFSSCVLGFFARGFSRRCLHWRGNFWKNFLWDLQAKITSEHRKTQNKALCRGSWMTPSQRPLLNFQLLKCEVSAFSNGWCRPWWRGCCRKSIQRHGGHATNMFDGLLKTNAILWSLLRKGLPHVKPKSGQPCRDHVY